MKYNNSKASIIVKGKGFTLTESVVALAILSLLLMLSFISLTSRVNTDSFPAKAQKLIGIMQQAANAASQSDRVYGVYFNFMDQEYVLYEIKTSDPYNFDILQEQEVVDMGFFDGIAFQLNYIEFDDGDYVDGSERDSALFVVTKNGWQFGGKIVLADENGQPWTVVINRLNTQVALEKEDVEILIPVQDLTF